MSKPITDSATKNNVIYWQQGSEECSVGEPAVLLEWYSDTISLSQDGNTIRLNYESLTEIAKKFNRLYRDYIIGNL